MICNLLNNQLELNVFSNGLQMVSFVFKLKMMQGGSFFISRSAFFEQNNL